MAAHIPETMRAMMLESFAGPLVAHSVPVPVPGRGEALVRVGACGVCGTDLKITRGKIQGVHTPFIPGHEPAGEVVALGPASHGVQVGDHVTVVIYLNCGACDYCRGGREQLCTHGRGRIGFTHDGGYAEYVRVPVANLCVVDARVPFEEVALLGDCLTTAWHAVTRRAQVRAGEWVYMTGVGGIGIHALQILKRMGALVAVADIDDAKLALAGRYGADLVLDARAGDLAARVRQTVGGDGADAALDFVATQTALDADFAVIRPGGVIVLVGYTPDSPSAVLTMPLVLNELRLIGSRAAGRKEFTEAIALLEEHAIEPVISRTYNLEQVNEALRDLRRGSITGRAVVVP